MRQLQGVGVLILAVVFVAGCVEPPTVVVQPLRVINWSPGSGSICINTDARVHITFSDDIVVETIDEESLSLLDSVGAVTATSAYDKTTFTVTLTPATALDYGRLYTVMAKTEITGARQGPLPVELTASFETVGRTGCTPAADCQHPSDCDTGQLCSSIGTCIDECVTNFDCPTGGTCDAGSCI